jgi:ferritin
MKLERHQQVLEHERKVTGMIHRLEIVAQLKMIGDQGLALFLLGRELGGRKGEG